MVHQRLGLKRIDDELQGDITAVAGVVGNELDEGLDLRRAALDALNELELPGSGVAVRQPGARGARDAGLRRADVSPEMLLQAPAHRSSTAAADGAAIRVRASDRTHKNHAFRIVAWTPLAPFDRGARDRARTRLASVFRSRLLVAASGGWLLGWRALRPLSAMAAQADRIDHRRLDDRLPVPNPRDELGRLGTAFNALLDRLSNTVQAQRRFMADASHELRTPVSIARTDGAGHARRGPARTEVEYQESLEIVAAQTRRLTRMVDDMFMLALADIDGRPLDIRDLYLDEVVKECVRAARVLADTREITVTSTWPPDVQTRGDEGLLRQLVMNLLENAVRHTPDGGVGARRPRDSTDRPSSWPSKTPVPAFQRPIAIASSIGSCGWRRLDPKAAPDSVCRSRAGSRSGMAARCRSTTARSQAGASSWYCRSMRSTPNSQSDPRPTPNSQRPTGCCSNSQPEADLPARASRAIWSLQTQAEGPPLRTRGLQPPDSWDVRARWELGVGASIELGVGVLRIILRLTIRMGIPRRFSGERATVRACMGILPRARVLIAVSLFLPSAAAAQADSRDSKGEAVYQAACAACHGPDGRGLTEERVGFDTPIPDFTDCSFATPGAGRRLDRRRPRRRTGARVRSPDARLR